MRLFDYRTRKYIPWNIKPKGAILHRKEFMKENKLNFKLFDLLVNIGWVEKYVGDDNLLNAQYKWTCVERKQRVIKYNDEINDFIANTPLNIVKHIHKYWISVSRYINIMGIQSISMRLCHTVLKRD